MTTEDCRAVLVRKRLSTVVTKLPSKVLCAVCLKLNHKDPRYKDFGLLAQKLDFSSDCINNLNQGNLKTNPTDKLLRCWEQDKGSNATVGNLIKILEHKDLSLTSAVEVLQNCSASDVITKIDPAVYLNLCWKLNVPREESFKDFRMLGEKQFDMTTENCRDVLVRKRLSTEVIKLPSKVLCAVCLKLNRKDPRYKNFRLLGQKLHFSSDNSITKTKLPYETIQSFSCFISFIS